MNNKYYLTDAQIEEAVEVITRTRDFCGDESDALREWRLVDQVLITFGDAEQMIFCKIHTTPHNQRNPTKNKNAS